jgi:hypothetical protein
MHSTHIFSDGGRTRSRRPSLIPRFRRQRPTTTTPRHRSSSQQPADTPPASCAAAAPRRAFAAPRDGHALRVGALTGPRPRARAAAPPVAACTKSASMSVRPSAAARRTACLLVVESQRDTLTLRLPTCPRASLVLLCAPGPWLVGRLVSRRSPLCPTPAPFLVCACAGGRRSEILFMYVCCTSYLPTALALLAAVHPLRPAPAIYCIVLLRFLLH